MKKILVPTDFSEGSFNALIHAMHHARAMNASITVIHAYLMPPTGTAVMVDITEMLRKNAEEGLENLKEEIRQLEISHGLEITYKAKHGTVGDVLERTVEKKEIDLVIMGTQGASGITEKFLGSNAAAAAKHLKAPLITVPAEKPFVKPKKIVIATDLKKIGKQKLFDPVAVLAKSHEAEVRFLHVRRTDEAFDHAQSEAYKTQVTEAFDGKAPLFTFVFENDIEDGLTDAIEKDGTDLLVVVQKERGFFQSLFHDSVSQALINEASLPVLVLHD